MTRASKREEIQIRILATTDLHAHFMNFDYYRDEVVDQFGLVALANLIEQARGEVENTLLFDNGDLIQGCPLGDYMREYALERRHPAYILMNELGYDAATLGNHEFNFGLPFLETILAQADFPYLCANLTTPEGIPWIRPYTILERQFRSNRGALHQINIGVIGVLPPQVTTWDKNHFDQYAAEGMPLTTHDIQESVAHYLPKLQAEGADLIVVLAHTGYSVEPYEQGAENSAYYLTKLEGVDVVIAGHQHKRFPSNDFAHLSDYGFDVERGLINGIPSVMAGSWSRYLGEINLTLCLEQHQWVVGRGESRLRSLAKEGASDNSINLRYLERLNEAHEVARKAMNVPIGVSNSEFYSYLSLVQDDRSVQIVADAQSYVAKQYIEQLAPDQMGIPLLSAVPLFKVGSRKDDPTYYTEIPKGALSFKDVADLYVYPNQLVVLTISGNDLREWLECCVSIYHQIDVENNKLQPLINWDEYRSYNVDIIKGVEYSIDLREPPRYDGDLHLIDPNAHRINLLTYQGKAVAPDDTFLLATNSYRALVDRFPGAGRGNALIITMDEIPDVLKQYVEHFNQQGRAVEVEPDYNWTFDYELLKGCQLYFESSNNPDAETYILENSLKPAQYLFTDEEGFHCYRLLL